MSNQGLGILPLEQIIKNVIKPGKFVVGTKAKSGLAKTLIFSRINYINVILLAFKVSYITVRGGIIWTKSLFADRPVKLFWRKTIGFVVVERIVQLPAVKAILKIGMVAIVTK